MKDRFWGFFSVFVSLLLAISLIFNAILIGVMSVKRTSEEQLRRPEFVEQVMEPAESEKVTDKIAVIDLVGVISTEIEGQTGDTMVDDVVLKLRQAREDEDVKAVVLRIDSPGGEVNASDVLYHEVKKTRAEKPVVVYMESVAASGGYYAAMGASYIMASDLTITASIGVIMQALNYKDLMGKIGVRTQTFKSGKMKDLLNPARDSTPEEEEYIQKMIDETYGKFVGIVAKERKLKEENLRQGVADGRIVSGKVALQEKLVDQLGYLEDAVRKAKELSKVEDAEIIRYLSKYNMFGIFRFFAQSAKKKSITLQVGPETLPIQAGKLYYLSGHLFTGQ